VDVGDGLKRVLVGRKLSSAQLGATLLPKRIALPVFASDALSSVAYAPDEILLTLSLGGMAAIGFSWQIGLLVAVVMATVVLSYRQTVRAYPSGGGDYEVATANIGASAGQVVASALLVDYVLTVAVSVSSGVQNAKAMIPAITGHEGLVAAFVILVLMGINLRGVRESAGAFVIPAYAFMLGVLGMAGWGLARIVFLGEQLKAPTADYTIVGQPENSPFLGLAMLALLARAFSSGSVALTGIEAISNGVPGFREPKAKNATRTLALLGALTLAMGAGVIALAGQTGLKMVSPDGLSHFELNGTPVTGNSVTAMGQLAITVFGPSSPGFFFVMTATVLILCVAANTAFNGFPVLGSVLARDGFLPRALYTRGDRLAYSNGIIVLSLAALGLVIAFGADVNALIQLYVVGVFASFTVSQFGMVRHWTRHLRAERDAAARRRMHRSRAINLAGFGMTATVLVVVLVSKFTHGAYLAILAMACLLVLMRSIRAHYDHVGEEVALDPHEVRMLPSRVHAVIFVIDLNKPAMRALNFARASRPNLIEAVTVAADADQVAALRADWEAQQIDIPLKIVASPYREVVGPFLNYVRGLRSGNPRDIVCVYIPEYIVGHWWERLLHNQTTMLMKTRLAFITGVMVTSVPYQLASGRRAIERVRSTDAAWRRSGTGRVRSGVHIDEGP
jgi:amino acid transporter